MKKLQYLVVLNDEHIGLYDTEKEAQYRVDCEIEWYKREARKWTPGSESDCTFTARIYIQQVGRIIRRETITY